MITGDMIKDGIEKGTVQLIIDPNMDSGTVCKIGDLWFYFGGADAEELDPDEYMSTVKLNETVENILDTLNDFRVSGGEFLEEYLYYEGVLMQKNVFILYEENAYDEELRDTIPVANMSVYDSQEHAIMALADRIGYALANGFVLNSYCPWITADGCIQKNCFLEEVSDRGGYTELTVFYDKQDDWNQCYTICFRRDVIRTYK